MALANFVQAAEAGQQAGQGQGNENALGMFIRGMLQKHQQRQASGQEFQQDIQKIGLTEMFKAAYKEKDKVDELQKFKKQIFTQASNDAFKEAGGSMMIGIGKKKEDYINRRNQLYTEYLKKFDISNIELPEEGEDVSNMFDNPDNLDLLADTVW